jgi:hypothetical protein
MKVSGVRCQGRDPGLASENNLSGFRENFQIATRFLTPGT